jgi:hypothetical protein
MQGFGHENWPASSIMAVTMKALLSLTLVMLAVLPSFGSSQAIAADHPQFPPTVHAMGRDLQLNGIGLRTATIFNVKVYEAGLYLPRRSSDSSQILQSKDPKVVRLSFLRDVTHKQVQDAWQEGLEKNCGADCEALEPLIQQFSSHMPAAKNGDVFVYVFNSKGVSVIENSKPIFGVQNPKFAQTVLATWLGKEPPSQDLKEAMLGLKSSERVS